MSNKFSNVKTKKRVISNIIGISKSVALRASMEKSFRHSLTD